MFATFLSPPQHTVVKSLENSTFSGSGFHRWGLELPTQPSLCTFVPAETSTFILVFTSCSLGIIYGIFSFSNLLAPMVVAVIGPKICMFISGLLYR